MAIKDIANKANKNPNNFNVILLTYPNIVGSKNQDEGQRFPLTGTIDQAGNDIQMGIDHIIFGYFHQSPIGRDVDKMIDITKQLSKFAR